MAVFGRSLVVAGAVTMLRSVATSAASSCAAGVPAASCAVGADARDDVAASWLQAKAAAHARQAVQTEQAAAAAAAKEAQRVASASSQSDAKQAEAIASASPAEATQVSAERATSVESAPLAGNTSSEQFPFNILGSSDDAPPGPWGVCEKDYLPAGWNHCLINNEVCVTQCGMTHGTLDSVCQAVNGMLQISSDGQCDPQRFTCPVSMDDAVKIGGMNAAVRMLGEVVLNKNGVEFWAMSDSLGGCSNVPNVIAGLRNFQGR